MILLLSQLDVYGGFNGYPDDKGTESNAPGTVGTSGSAVSMVIPMTRGLKDIGGYDSMEPTNIVSMVIPMTRGLKGVIFSLLFVAGIFCFNGYPDDKGTESTPHNLNIT